MNVRRQVVVVGAGPAGLVTALAMRGRGIHTTLLEAGPAERTRPGSRAVYIHRTSLQLLEEIRPGLGSKLAAAGLVWRGKRTLFRGREVYRRAYPESRGDRLPPFTSLAQSQTERILIDECLAAGVEIQWNSSVTAVETTGSTATLQICDGDSVEADFVVAADGPRSAVRRSLGVRMSGSRTSHAFVVVDLEDDPEHPMPLERTFHYEHPELGHRNLLMLPFAGGWRLDLQCLPSEDPSIFTSDSGLSDWVAKVFPRRHSKRVSWVTTYTYMQCVAEQFRDRTCRVLLVGEAAHMFSPFGARGLNSGIADAYAAENAISAALQARSSSAHRAAIDVFNRNRRLAAQVNRRASSAGLAIMQGHSLAVRAKRTVAAQLARLGHTASGRWLDSAPYGSPLKPSRASKSGY